MTFIFAQRPEAEDYGTLATHLVSIQRERLHSALWPRRDEVAEQLQRMGQEPEREAHRAAYHALRLLVW